MEKYCKENGFLCWMDTSAKDDTNVSDAITKLVHEVVKNIKDIQDDNLNKKYLEDPDEYTSSPIIKLTNENNSANGTYNNGKATNITGNGIRPNANIKSSSGDGCAC
mgnify:CR=1 FL=1